MDHLRRNAGCYGCLVLVLLIVIVIPIACVAGANLGGVFARPEIISVMDLLGLISLPEPEPPPPPVVTIQGVRKLAELATVEYTVVVDVTNERIPDDFRQYLGAKEEILLLVYGKVKAGFDLNELKEEDLWRDGTRVQLHLPAPEILSIELDYESTRVVHYEKSLLVSNDPTLQGETLQIAQEAIREAALKEGILDKAREYGELFFENHLRELGFTEVHVITN